MTQSRSRKKPRDEIEFPIRIRYSVPEVGYGVGVNEIFDWLDQEIGRGEYAHNSDSLPGAVDCSAYYFRDREAANRFALMMEGRGLVLADPREGGWTRSG